MPNLPPRAWPVLAAYRHVTAARTSLKLRRNRRHIDIVTAKFGPPVAGRYRHCLLDTRYRPARIDVPLPATDTHRQTLTLSVNWWATDAHLLLATGPAHGIDLITADVRAAVHRVHPHDDDILAARRRTEQALSGHTHHTSAGLAWALMAIAAATTARPRPDWRRELDRWLHRELDTGHTD